MITIIVAASENDVIGKYSERDLNRMGNENLDLLVNFSESPIKGELLGIPFHGVISFQYGDMANHKKGPPGFWEVFKREKSTSFYIQSNHDNLGEENKILLKGSIPTNFFFSLNMIKLYKKSNIFMYKILEDILENKISKNVIRSEVRNQSSIIPSVFEQIKYILKTSAYLFKKFIQFRGVFLLFSFFGNRVYGWFLVC